MQERQRTGHLCGHPGPAELGRAQRAVAVEPAAEADPITVLRPPQRQPEGEPVLAEGRPDRPQVVTENAKVLLADRVPAAVVIRVLPGAGQVVEQAVVPAGRRLRREVEERLAQVEDALQAEAELSDHRLLAELVVLPEPADRVCVAGRYLSV